MDSANDRDLLERVLKLEQENYRILKSLRSSQRWGVIWGFIKLALVVGPLIIGYFYLQPYLDTLWGTYKQIQGQVNNIQKVTGQIGSQIPDIGGLLKQFQPARSQ